MLRSEHVMARLNRGRLVPHRLDPENPKALAAAAARKAAKAAAPESGDKPA